MLERFIGETFALHQKSTKLVKLFSHSTFVIYGITMAARAEINIMQVLYCNNNYAGFTDNS